MADRSDAPVGELEPTLAAGEAPTLASDSTPALGSGSGAGDGEAAELTTGTRLGRYKLGARIGAGAMGVVWAARDPNLDRPVAIKVVHPAFARMPDAAARLLREARAMAQVSHRAVVAVHDAGEAQGQLFLAMELVEGTTLGRMMRERDAAARGDWRRWLGLLVEAGRGLAAAHTAGIVHRDFKPDNVLVAHGGRVCVGDFGVAELSAASARAGSDLAPAASAQGMPVADLTMTGSLVGTPAYMSPEQLHGGDATARSDQFSFCVALHEALYGIRPFVLPRQAEHAVRTLIQTIEEGRLEPPPRDSRVPRWVRDALLRGLSPDPDRRWADMPSLLAALTPPRRWPVRVALLAGGLAAAAIAITALVVAADRGAAVTGAMPPAPAPEARVLEAHARFAVPMRPMIALSPDGARIAVASAERLVVRAADGAEVWQFTPGDGESLGRIEFADRDHVRIFVSRHAPTAGEVVVWDLVADHVDERRPILAGWTWLGTVAGGDLLTRAASPGVELVVGEGTTLRRIATAPSRLEVLAIAPDRRRIAYVEAAAYAGLVVVLDVTTGASLRGEPIVELSGLAWRDDRNLWLTTGTTTHPAIHELAVGADGLGAPRLRYQQDRGWFGQIHAAAGRTFFVDSANSFRAKMVSRGGAVEDLDPELVGAALGWLDDRRWLLWSRTTGDLAPDDDQPSQRVHAGIDGEPGNASRAGDLVMIAMRKPGGRELIGVSLRERRRLWTLPVGTAAMARCAGDQREPCVAVVQPDGDAARVHRLDPRTGELGDELARAPAIQDVALSDDGGELLICDGTPTLRVRTLATGAERALVLPMSNTRGVAYDPTGGILVAGTKAPVSYQILRIDGDAQTVLAQSDNEILFLPRASPDGQRVLVMGRLFMPELYELRPR